MNTIVMNVSTGVLKTIQFTGAELDAWNAANTIALAAVFPNAKAAFITQVKAEAGALTTQVLKGLESEYELAEKEATAYKAAGYPATPMPSSVQSEVNSKAAKGITITATVACDNILTAATSWRTAQAAMRDKRLTVTSAAEVAADTDALDVLKAQWIAFLGAMRLQFGV